ncbi:MAG: SGNH/GDSL hydrolase family protein [Gemmatimonadales bacterium]
MRLSTFAASLALGLSALSGCKADEGLRPPAPPPVPSGGAMFQRYVSLGNSITAGFQSAGINDSTQKRSYAVLLSQAMGASFVYPSLVGVGCPPPFVNNVTLVRIPGVGHPLDTLSTTCQLRASNALPNNLAVPGARALEILNNLGVPQSNSNALTLLFLGGHTQREALMLQRPSFVSLWIGNNDVLGALTSRPDANNPTANPGDPALVTDTMLFRVQYDSVLDAIQATGAKAVLISVANVTVIPYASLGAFYFCLKNGGCPPPLPAQLPQLAGIPTFTVSPTCAPAGGGIGLSTLVPWPIGLGLVQRAAAGIASTLDCTVDQLVITAAEAANMQAAVMAYNAHIAAEAAARGWAYLDVNPILLSELQSGANPGGRIPPFPNALGAFANPPQPITFGPLFTLDGVHPSSLTHEILADSVASAINAKYGTSLPIPICNTVACPAP